MTDDTQSSDEHETDTEGQGPTTMAAAIAAATAPAEEPGTGKPVEVAPEDLRAVLGNITALNPIWAVGRRKSSSARVRLFPGGGNVQVNGKPLEEYFCLLRDQRTALAPLSRLSLDKEYDVRVNVHGGGTTGQSGAVSLGIARALIKLRPSSEQELRGHGLLTRDARVAERKKYGRRGARRGFQFSKR
jgi:small subunit ribosomal protein S9